MLFDPYSAIPVGAASGASQPSVLQRFFAAAADSTAVVFLPDGELTGAVTLNYGQLQERARRVAAALRQQGAASERVLLLLPPGQDYFAAVWGCLLAGVVVVPVALPKAPAQAQFVAGIAADSGAAFLLTDAATKGALTVLLQPHLQPQVQSNLQSNLQSHLQQEPPRWLLLEQLLEHQPVTMASPAASAVALLQYTSGSTGQPKGVIVTHGNLAASVDLMLQYAAMDAESVLVSWLPLFHNMGFISFGMLPLCAGARLVLMPTESFMVNPARWFKAISHFRGTHSGGPNIGYESCLNFLPDQLLDQLDLDSWRVAAIGSEPLKAALIDRFAARFGRCGFRPETFITTYGFSEATVFSAGSDHHALMPRLAVNKSSFERNCIEPVQNADDVKTLIGVGRAGPHVAVVDPDSRQHCGDRELGEVWIQGATVAAGYWNKPQASAETFGIFTADGQGPFVRSGDIGVMADGNLYVVGRRKELIIVGGKKLHPLDLEQVINGIDPAFVPYATAAASWQRGDSETLAIFQELKPDAAENVAADAIVATIRATLFQRFGVNVDRVVLQRMGSLPRTGNGKLQRLRCCAQVDSGALGSGLLLDWRVDGRIDERVNSSAAATPAGADEQAIVGPRTAMERQLAALWSDLMNRTDLSIDDDFFRLGGQSIIATRIVARLRQQLGVDLSIRALFMFPSVRLLAAHIETLHQTGGHGGGLVMGNVGDIGDIAIDGWLPLSPAQKRLWFLSRIDPASAAYHMSASFLLVGALDQDCLHQALGLLVQRHQMLHTVYRSDEQGDLWQRPLAEYRFALDRYELDAPDCQQADPEPRIDAILLQHQNRPFDLGRDLLLRACLIRVSPGRHVLSFTVHHIAADGWSIGILTADLMALYPALQAGETPLLAPAQNHYLHYAVRQLRQAEPVAALAYWRQQLQDIPPLHRLPLHPLSLHRPFTRMADYQGQSLRTLIDAATLQRLRAAGQQQGLTLFMQLQAALALLMMRLGGTTEAVFGVPFANRDTADCEVVVGFFVNTLVMRHQADPAAPVAVWLAQVRETVLQAYAHADVPFDLLVEKLNPQRNGNHNPLFQVMLNLQNKDTWDLQLPGIAATARHVDGQITKFDLSVDCTESASGVEIVWEYNHRLFDAGSIQRWSGYFQRLLAGLCDSPDLPLAQLPWLDAAEYQWLLNAGQGVTRPQPEGCLHHYIEHQAAMHPDAVAVVYGNSSLNYAELNARANQLAHALLALDLQPDDRIALCVERSLHSIVAMLGVLKAGAAYVPLDPANPPQRLGFLLQDCSPRAVLTHSSLQAQLPPTAAPVLVLDAGFDQPLHNPVGNGATSASLACVMYTSGSTGTPKGVMVEHRQLLNLVCNNDYAPLQPQDRVAHCANPVFDAASWEIWATLVNGARLVIVSPETLLAPAALCRYLIEHEVNVLLMTVSLFNHCCDQLQDVLAQLKYCMIGGEAVDSRTLKRLLPHALPQHLLNVYGPTETTTFATTHEIRMPQQADAVAPIGRPLANTRIYILDPQGEPVPVGVTGEIHVAGDQVTRGYLNQPDLTAQRFSRDPGSSPEYARCYKTGDLGCWREDGTLEYRGRNDSQVKIRGYRIELGEIQSRLLECSGVREAVVIACPDGSGEVRLIAYVVPEQDLTVHAETLRLALASSLADFMLPSAFVCLPQLPLTPNGKLDQAALPAPDRSSLAAPGYEAPHNAIEIRLTHIWQTLLAMERIGRHDNFFSLGGHSLLAVRLSNAIQREFLLSVPLRTLFELPTIAKFSAVIQMLMAEGNADVDDLIYEEGTFS